MRDQAYVDLDNRISAAKVRFSEHTNHIWDFQQFNAQAIPPFAFQFLMGEIHAFLRHMRHCVGKKVRVVLYE